MRFNSKQYEALTRPSDERCSRCGRPVSLTPDWILWPWPDGARLCAACNDARHKVDDYNAVVPRTQQS